jgi:ribosomal protein L25 (general stress protein Ctc)
MIIDANLRDLKIKGKKFINEGKTIGVILRSNGETLPISVKRSDMDKFLKKYGDHSNVILSINGENINTSIAEVQRDIVLHYAHNVQFKEI